MKEDYEKGQFKNARLFTLACTRAETISIKGQISLNLTFYDLKCHCKAELLAK